MIQYALKCTDGHRFDSWFQSAEAFDKLAQAGMIACAICGTTEVSKSVMAPRVTPGRKAAPVPARPDAAGQLSTPGTPQEQAMAQLKQHIEQNSEDVGTRFATEARKMHDGDAPERAIHGEAKPDEARKLIEDGVPVAPLPFRLTRKTN